MFKLSKLLFRPRAVIWRKPAPDEKHAANRSALKRSRARLAAANKRLQAENRRAEHREKLKQQERHLNTLLSQSLQMQEHLRQLSLDLLWAQEEERKTISRELHDDIAQTLMGIKFILATLKMEASVNTNGLTRKSLAHSGLSRSPWISCIALRANCAQRCWTISA